MQPTLDDWAEAFRRRVGFDPDPLTVEHTERGLRPREPWEWYARIAKLELDACREDDDAAAD